MIGEDKDFEGCNTGREESVQDVVKLLACGEIDGKSLKNELPYTVGQTLSYGGKGACIAGGRSS